MPEACFLNLMAWLRNRRSWPSGGADGRSGHVPQKCGKTPANPKHHQCRGHVDLDLLFASGKLNVLDEREPCGAFRTGHVMICQQRFKRSDQQLATLELSH